MFQTLSRKELRFVADTVHQRTFKPGEPIFRQGEIGVGMYIIRADRSKCTLTRRATRPRDARW